MTMMMMYDREVVDERFATPAQRAVGKFGDVIGVDFLFISRVKQMPKSNTNSMTAMKFN